MSVDVIAVLFAVSGGESGEAGGLGEYAAATGAAGRRGLVHVVGGAYGL